MMIGYARVSTQGQDLDQQRAALGAAGCIRLFEEKGSGAKRDRSELVKLLDHLRPGDVVTVTRLDRLARSTRDLLDIAKRIREAGAGFAIFGRAMGRHDDAGRPHGVDRVRRRCGFRAILDRRAHQRRPDRGQGAWSAVRSLPCPIGRPDHARPSAHRPRQASD